MTRLALAVVLTAAAGVTTALTHHHPRRPTPAQSDVLAAVLPLRASRAQERQPLPGRQTSLGHMRQGATPTHRRAPVRRLGPSRPAPGSALLDITAYCATGSRTASGQWPHAGMAAGNRWPFGTVLHIDGYGDVTIEDRIGWGSDVDIYLGDSPDCEQRASDFGRQHRVVAVVS